MIGPLLSIFFIVIGVTLSGCIVNEQEESIQPKNSSEKIIKSKEALREEIRQAEEKKKKRDKELMDSRFPQTKKKLPSITVEDENSDYDDAYNEGYEAGYQAGEEEAQRRIQDK